MSTLITIPTAGLVAIGIMPPLIATARRVGVVDKPGGRKQHAGHVPLAGGLALYLTLLLSSALAAALGSIISTPFLALAGAVVAAGLVDDFHRLPAWPKLAWQIAVAALAVICGGPEIGDPARLFGAAAGAFGTATGPIGVSLTVFVYVALMNAINLLDGADGVAGGVGAVILAGLSAVAWECGVAGAAPAAILFGALVGFLNFNMPVVRRGRPLVFLGDAGSMLIGFALAWCALDLYQAAPRLPAASFLWLLGLPALDMARVALGRLRRGVSPFSAGREHLHHLLLAVGMTRVATALAMLSGALALVATAVAGIWLQIGNVAFAIGFVAPCAIYLGAIALLRQTATAAADMGADPAGVATVQQTARLRRAA